MSAEARAKREAFDALRRAMRDCLLAHEHAINRLTAAIADSRKEIERADDKANAAADRLADAMDEDDVGSELETWVDELPATSDDVFDGVAEVVLEDVGAARDAIRRATEGAQHAEDELAAAAAPPGARRSLRGSRGRSRR